MEAKEKERRKIVADICLYPKTIFNKALNKKTSAIHTLNVNPKSFVNLLDFQGSFWKYNTTVLKKIKNELESILKVKIKGGYPDFIGQCSIYDETKHFNIKMELKKINIDWVEDFDFDIKKSEIETFIRKKAISKLSEKEFNLHNGLIDN
jgi:hypothetical protein